MRRGAREYGALYLLILLVAAVGCGRAINRSAERRIRDAMPDVLGPARQYRAHVENSPSRTLGGHLANVAIDGDDVQLTNGLLIDRLHLDLSDVDVDQRKGQVRHIRETRFSATVSEASLDEFLAGENPPEETLRKIRLTLTANSVTIAAERIVLGVGIPFRMTGPLRLAGPQRIEIDPTRLTVVGIPISGKPLQFLKGRFESAVDLSTLPFPISLTSVQSSAGSLTLSGTADTEALIQRAQEQKR